MLTLYGPAPEPVTVATGEEPSEPETLAVTVTAADQLPIAVDPSDVDPAASDTGDGGRGAVKSAGEATATRSDVLATCPSAAVPVRMTRYEPPSERPDAMDTE
jgi:hypothetical protein